MLGMGAPTWRRTRSRGSRRQNRRVPRMAPIPWHCDGKAGETPPTRPPPPRDKMEAKPTAHSEADRSRSQRETSAKACGQNCSWSATAPSTLPPLGSSILGGNHARLLIHAGQRGWSTPSRNRVARARRSITAERCSSSGTKKRWTKGSSGGQDKRWRRDAPHPHPTPGPHSAGPERAFLQVYNARCQTGPAGSPTCTRKRPPQATESRSRSRADKTGAVMFLSLAVRWDGRPDRGTAYGPRPPARHTVTATDQTRQNLSRLPRDARRLGDLP